MKRNILTYGLTTLFAIGFAGFSYGYGIPPMPKIGSMATPVFLDSIFGGKQEVKKEVALYPIHDDEGFNNDELMETHEIVPYQTVELGFSIRIPKGWQYSEDYESKTEAELNQKLLGNIARFDSPRISTYQPRLIVQALELPHEISAKHWLRHHILISGYTPDSEIESKNPREASGYYIYLEDGNSMRTYVRALINKDTMLVAKFEIPSQMRTYMEYIQRKTLESFTLTYPEEGPVEATKSFTLVDSIKLNFPASWLVSDPDFRDMNRLVVSLKNKSESGALQGFVHITAVRRNRNTSLRTELENLKLYYEDTMKLEFLKLESSGKSPAYDRFMFNRYEVYEVKNKQRGEVPQKLHLAVLGDKEWYVIMYLLSPREDDNLYSWARNIASFEAILQSIK